MNENLTYEWPIPFFISALMSLFFLALVLFLQFMNGTHRYSHRTQEEKSKKKRNKNYVLTEKRVEDEEQLFFTEL